MPPVACTTVRRGRGHPATHLEAVLRWELRRLEQHCGRGAAGAQDLLAVRAQHLDRHVLQAQLPACGGPGGSGQPRAGACARCRLRMHAACCLLRLLPRTWIGLRPALRATLERPAGWCGRRAHGAGRQGCGQASSSCQSCSDAADAGNGGAAAVMRACVRPQSAARAAHQHAGQRERGAGPHAVCRAAAGPPGLQHSSKSSRKQSIWRHTPLSCVALARAPPALHIACCIACTATATATPPQCCWPRAQLQPLQPRQPQPQGSLSRAARPAQPAPPAPAAAACQRAAAAAAAAVWW